MERKMNQAEKRKDCCKKLLAVLAVVLLVLTFFSKSLYNYRLPVVTAALPKQGRLAFTVEGSSELTYASIDSVYAESDGRIRELLVEKGEEVKAGQPVMKFESSETGEMHTVTAQKDGIITAVKVSRGMYVSSMQNTVLYEIAGKSEEWACFLPISEEQRERINMESVPVLEIVSRKESVKGKIRSIIPYANEKMEGYQAAITVQMADASLAGERVNVTIGEEGELYDTLIPAAALSKDAEGYYVLVLQEDDSVLGDGYKAARRSVDLLDSDESYCAVRGLPADEQVILASDGEISDGSSVFYEEDEMRGKK